GSGGHAARRVEALLHGQLARALGGLPAPLQATGVYRRRRRALGARLARMGDHHAGRYDRALGDRVEGRVVPRLADRRVRAAEGSRPGAPSGALGHAGVLSRAQHGERRPRQGARSLRGSPMTAKRQDGPLRDAPLAIDSATFRTWGHALVDQIASLLDSIPSRPVTPGETPSDVRSALDLNGPLPEEGMDGGKLLEETARKLFDHSLFNGHPRFFGYITASPAPIGMLGDLLAASANPNVGGWVLAPAASEIEAQTIRWIGELIEFPASEGILVSGGNMANIVAF